MNGSHRKSTDSNIGSSKNVGPMQLSNRMQLSRLEYSLGDKVIDRQKCMLADIDALGSALYAT